MIIRRPKSKIRILLVEDQVQIRALLSEILADFDVTAVASGEAAIAEVARGRAFDMVICDYRMPGMNGAETLCSIRTSSPLTRRILVSACAVQELEMAARAAGADAWLNKPFDSDELLQTVVGCSANIRLESLASRP